MSGPSTKKVENQPPPAKDDTDAGVESEVGEEDPGSAVDMGETETLTREDVRNSET
jgi:hypothetical protein